MLKRNGLPIALAFFLLLPTVSRAQTYLNCSAPKIFDEFAAGSSSVPSVATNPAGDTTAIWRWENDGTFETHVARYSTVTSFWTSVFVLTSSPNFVDSPQVAVGATGQPFAVWAEQLSGRYDVFIQPFNGNNLSNLTAANPGQDNRVPQVAVDDSDEAHLVWVSTNGGKSVIQTARSYGSGDQWVGPATLSDVSQSASFPQIGVDHEDNAHAVWSLFNGSQAMVQTAAYDWSNNAWSTPVSLGEGGAFAQVAVTPAGDAHFLWIDSHGAVQTARYSRADKAWIGRTLVASSGSAQQIAASPTGDAMAVWVGSQNTIETARYSVTTQSWSTPTTVVDLQDGVSREPAIAIGPLGDAVVVWAQFKTGYSVVYGAYYKSPIATPAISAIGLGREPHVALAKTTATVVWNTTACSLSAGCPTPGRVQALRCETPKRPTRRHAVRP